MKEINNFPLLKYNTFGMDVKADLFIEYQSVDELCAYLSNRSDRSRPLLHIGGGSNLLFVNDFSGIILHSAIKGFTVISETDSEIEITAGAGEVWDDFVAYTVAHGWYGAENLSLIPGEVGASAVQNIGAYGAEAKDIIVNVDAIELETGLKRRFSQKECRYSYRQSIFKQELKGKYIITHVTYRLSKYPQFRLDYGNIRAELEKQGCEISLQNVRNVIINIRNSKLPDPEVLGNAGSFFMNPIIPLSQYEEIKKTYPDMPHYVVNETEVKIPAGWMIDRCGWKGKTRGHAGVHDRQALVLVNRGGATGEEIISLADEIIRSVRNTFGIIICPEVNYIR